MPESTVGPAFLELYTNLFSKAEFPVTETVYEQANISSEKRQILRVDAQIKYLKVMGNVA